MMVIVSLLDKKGQCHEIPQPIHEHQSRLVIVLWTILAVVMIGLYVFFN